VRRAAVALIQVYGLPGQHDSRREGERDRLAPTNEVHAEPDRDPLAVRGTVVQVGGFVVAGIGSHFRAASQATGKAVTMPIQMGAPNPMRPSVRPVLRQIANRQRISGSFRVGSYIRQVSRLASANSWLNGHQRPAKPGDLGHRHGGGMWTQSGPRQPDRQKCCV